MTFRFIAAKGLPASGKSTWAKKMIDDNPGDAVRVNRDLIREMLHNSNWSARNERLTVSVRDNAIRQAMMSGWPIVICDDTNLDPYVMQGLANLVEENSEYSFEIMDFTHVFVETCIERDAQREGVARVGSEVILGMYNKWIKEYQDYETLSVQTLQDGNMPHRLN